MGSSPLLFITPYVVSTYGYFFIGRHHCRAIFPEVMDWPAQGRGIFSPQILSGFIRFISGPKGSCSGGKFTVLRLYQVIIDPAKGVEFTDLRFYQVR